jgi:cellulose synthase/poly-beta-1,6-N-acetylglucosamine synthase-like glycosyltransferase
VPLVASIDPAEWALWGSAAAVLYVYVGYPLTLALAPARPVVVPGPAGPLPRVSILIAAFDEALHIGETLRNKIALDYPIDLLEVIVVSDGSTDGTDAVVEGFRPQGVRLLRQEPRQGKTMALNRAVEVATGDILVFSDANSLYAPDALRHLVTPFADPEVGYVTGTLLYRDPGQTLAGAGCGAYMRYENRLRTIETRVGSVVGVNGGIDAVRRDLYRPMRPDHLPDFILPLRVVEQGRRVVYAPAAVAAEETLQAGRDEFRMRVRVGLRSLRALAEMRALLSPRRGRFAFQLLMHKVLRYLVFLPLLAAFVANGFLWDRPLYRATMVAQAAFYATALLGWAFERRLGGRRWGLPYYFVLVNTASAVAFLRFLRGERQVLWTPRKGA